MRNAARTPVHQRVALAGSEGGDRVPHSDFAGDDGCKIRFRGFDRHVNFRRSFPAVSLMDVVQQLVRKVP